MNKKYVFILIILIALVAVFVFLSRKVANNNVLTLYGNIDIRVVNLGFRVSGRIEKLKFDEGDLVKPGQVMAVLDKKPYLNELMQAEGELNYAHANLLKLQNGFRKQEIASAKAVVREREAAYYNAVMLNERQNCIKNIGAVAKQEFDDTLTKRNEAESRLRDAQEQLSLALEGYRYEDIKAAEAQMEIAKAKLTLVNTNLADTEILSPSEGTILTRVRELGAVVNAGASVYALSIKEPVWVRTYINEVNLGKIYPGMKAKIYTDANPDKAYEGKIGFISPVAEFTPKNVETVSLRTDLVYRLRIIIEETDKFLRQGMPVTVKLYLNKNGFQP